MAGRHKQPKHGKIAATAALLVLAGSFAAPVLAAPGRDALCDKKLEANLEITADTMSTTIEAVADDHLLKPRVTATAREVFSDSSAKTETVEAAETAAGEDETTTPRLRPLSDNEVVPFRRQMYRKDI